MNNRKMVLGVIVTITLGIGIGVIPAHIHPQSAEAVEAAGILGAKAPIALTGNNVYVAWWTNKTGNDEVMFRASSDLGKTFGEKINLSNTTNADSQDVQIAADATNVVITWWERNQTSSEPILRISSDGGKRFGPLIKLDNNGTIGTGELKPLF